MVYVVIREILQNNTVVNYKNTFNDFFEARDFYNGTNGVLRVSFYKDDTLISEKGDVTPVIVADQTVEPIVETPVEQTVAQQETELPLETSTEAELTVDAVEDTVTSIIEETVEITPVMDAVVAPEQPVDKPEIVIDVDEYNETESETVVAETSEQVQQLIEKTLVNKINTSPTFSFINK